MIFRDSFAGPALIVVAADFGGSLDPLKLPGLAKERPGGVEAAFPRGGTGTTGVETK